LRHWIPRGGSVATLVAVAAALVAAASVCTSAAARPLELDDYRNLIGLSSPTISPDGRRAVVVVSRVEWSDDRYRKELDEIDLHSLAQRTLTYGRKGVAEPRFSPDGTKLAFIADEGNGDDAKPQVFVMPMSGGDSRPVTHAPGGVEQFAWRPDGAALAYAATEPEPKKSGAERFHDSFVFTDEPITAHGVPRPVHLFVIAADGTKEKRLTEGDESIATGEAQTSISWSPDGREIAAVITPSAILNEADRGRVEIIDASSGGRRRLTAHDGFESEPRFAPDGLHFSYLYSAGDNQINLTEAFVTIPAGGEGRAVSRRFDRAVHETAWSPDSSNLLFGAADGTSLAILRAPTDGSPLSELELGDVIPQSPLDGAIARDGSLVFVGSSPGRPAELYHVTHGAKPERVTDYNAFIAGLSLGQAERITYKTSLGLVADGVLLRPPGFTPGKKYPLVLRIHGGPTSASLLSFDFQAQLLAARGWLVLEPNYRGSDNLGYAYQHAVLYDPDEGPGKDIMAAVQAVEAKGSVDETRLAVSGWSYGGIMTAWMISRYHVWRAAVSGASVNDWATDYGTADDADSDKALFHGSPFVAGNAPEWRKASAISYARDVTTPVLILSDVGDNRDTFATSAMYYHALRDNGKDATFVAWPVQGHFPRDPVRLSDVFARWTDFIAQHFK
jgi:dipeptidyl aminopeptidase/acylaminoacyl peptidase